MLSKTDVTTSESKKQPSDRLICHNSKPTRLAALLFGNEILTMMDKTRNIYNMSDIAHVDHDDRLKLEACESASPTPAGMNRRAVLHQIDCQFSVLGVLIRCS